MSDLGGVDVAFMTAGVTFGPVASRSTGDRLEFFLEPLDLAGVAVGGRWWVLEALDVGPELVEEVAVGSVEVLAGYTGLGGQGGGVQLAVGVDGPAVEEAFHGRPDLGFFAHRE